MEKGSVKIIAFSDKGVEVSALGGRISTGKGTALEMFTALAVSGTGLFRECYTRVLLDCDGVVRTPEIDPTNELDVVAMYGPVPLFISCKNTEATKEYLYEISTMAQHYGGKYGIPMLVTSRPAPDTVRERAREMGILIADNVEALSLRQFREALCGIIKGALRDN